MSDLFGWLRRFFAPRYEYKVFSATASKGVTDEQLTGLGKDGWRVTHVSNALTECVFVMERRL